MRDYNTLTDAEINAKLAEKMGWVHRIFFGDERWWVGDKPGRDYDNWDPCTSRDDLAVVVAYITELRKAVMLDRATVKQWRKSPLEGFLSAFLLLCPTRIIAEACLEVLEG